jgi:hypothetical protein
VPDPDDERHAYRGPRRDGRALTALNAAPPGEGRTRRLGADFAAMTGGLAVLGVLISVLTATGRHGPLRVPGVAGRAGAGVAAGRRVFFGVPLPPLDPAFSFREPAAPGHEVAAPHA